jgi:hypothetical protein
MIHIATCHWVDPKWISPQQRGLSSFLEDPYRVYANLQGVDSTFDGRFAFVSREGGAHADKLNALAEVIADEADPADLLVFLDGDAFPIRPLQAWLPGLLAEHPLAAVRRDENGGDVQPHPCFCVTTVGFWAAIQGDWRPGPWHTAEGVEASDVGGRLLRTLDEQSIGWRPILRSNAVNLHPVLYGVYEGHVYHHGAGFRPAIARADEDDVPVAQNERYLYLRTQARHKSLMDLRPRHAPQLVGLARDGLRNRKLNAHMRREGRRSNKIHSDICADPDFFRRFETPGPAVSV